MPKLPRWRSWFIFGWLASLTWPEWIIAGALAIVPLAVLLVGGAEASGLAGGLVVAECIAVGVVVQRRGGWHLLGPHYFYDVVRLARRGRSTFLRVIFLLMLFLGLAIVYFDSPQQFALQPNDLARVATRFAFALLVTQNIAVMLLTPAYLGSAIAEERERRTLELLFTTHLSSTEIVLGKLVARVIHLIGFVLAGLPILSLIQFWGGIDMTLIVGNLINTVLNILTVGSICLLLSSLSRSVTVAVTVSYAVILPLGGCCLVAQPGFPFVLYDARAGGAGSATVQDLGPLFIAHMVVVASCLTLAIVTLRDRGPESPILPPGPRRTDVAPGKADAPRRKPAPAGVEMPPEPLIERPRPLRLQEPENEFSMPYTLPPVSDNALLWKERYVGGPSWFFTPVIIVPALPFLVTGIAVMLLWFVRSFFLSEQEHRRAVEGWAIALRVVYYLCLAAYALGVGVRTASSVARERQQQTLEPLLLLPIDRRDVLLAKLLGSLLRGWPWLALLALNIVLGTLMGAYHPYSAVLLSVAPWALIAFIACLGLLLSVTMETVLRANMFLLIIVITLTGMTFVLPYGMGPFTYLDPLAYSQWLDSSLLHRIHDGPHRQTGFPPSAGSLVWCFVYALTAVVCLLVAFRRFDDRTRATGV